MQHQGKRDVVQKAVLHRLVFPGTLLLLRMGYMTISPEGELIFTDKYSG